MLSLEKAVRYRGVKDLSYTHFIERKGDDSNILEEISEGVVFRIRECISRSLANELVEFFVNPERYRQSFVESDDHRMLQGIKNISYTSSPQGRLKDGKQTRYSACDRSFYIFPWNQDQSMLTHHMRRVYGRVHEVQGCQPENILANTPKDGIVQRIHVIHYPPQTGHISVHVDPVNVCRASCGLYLTEYKEDYQSGGFFVLDEQGDKIYVDHQMGVGDLLLFYPGIPYGVDPVKCESNSRALGRLFVDMKIVQSHCCATRQTTKPFVC